jgi:hypothetical protein
MSETSLTVLMTVRNGEPYVEAAVRSILTQTYDDFKFLILDNASADRTREIIRDFRDSRIKLTALEQDLGHTGALNHGLALVDTPYVARMDADDVSLPLRLERQMEFVAGHPEVALLGTWFEGIDSEGNVIDRHTPPAEHVEVLKAMLFENPFAHTSTVFNRQAALACGGYDLSYRCAQDYALWWRIALVCRVANLPEFLVQVRSHGGQASHTFKREGPGELLRIAQSALREPRLPGEVRRLTCRAEAYANLKYAAGISEAGHRLKGLVRMARGIARAPSLVTQREGATFMARAFRTWPGFGTVRGRGRSPSP